MRLCTRLAAVVRPSPLILFDPSSLPIWPSLSPKKLWSLTRLTGHTVPTLPVASSFLITVSTTTWLSVMHATNVLVQSARVTLTMTIVPKTRLLSLLSSSATLSNGNVATTAAVLSNVLRVVTISREFFYYTCLHLTDALYIAADVALSSATSAQLIGEHAHVLDSASLMFKLEPQTTLAAEFISSLPNPPCKRILLPPLPFLLRLPGLPFLRLLSSRLDQSFPALQHSLLFTTLPLSLPCHLDLLSRTSLALLFSVSLPLKVRACLRWLS